MAAEGSGMAASEFEGKAALVGNEKDVLHSGYTHAFSDQGKRYPSVDHYAHAMTFRRLGMDDVLILELLATSSSDVTMKAMQLIRQNMPKSAYSFESLAGYLSQCRDAFTMQGLRLRYKQDVDFVRALMDTGDKFLVVCDERDSEFGVGMNEQSFLDWIHDQNITITALDYWMRNDRSRPSVLGRNKLGMLLMWLRHEVIAEERHKKLSPLTITISKADYNEACDLVVSEMVVALEGVFQPLSNYYVVPMEIKGEKFRSVEHYAYQRLFDSLGLDDKAAEKLRTTVDPAEVWLVAERVISQLDSVSDDIVTPKLAKMDKWRMSGMKHKVNEHILLKRMLLTTGDSLIIETSQVGDTQWTVMAEEKEIQHLLTKSYITPKTLVDWMTQKETPPRATAHIGGNKTGLFLMELRQKLRAAAKEQGESAASCLLPLVAPISVNAIKTMLSPHMICFTAESVFHPIYMAEIRSEKGRCYPSPAHFICEMTAKYINCTQEEIDEMLAISDSPGVFLKLSQLISCQRPLPFERLYQWHYTEQVNIFRNAMRLLFDQHSPLMRALLDTNDSLLVYCNRYSSRDGEWSIGMRERDLRAWCAHIDISTQQLFEMSGKAVADRPAFLGANRLGVILMELRREFFLKGVFPQQLPSLSLPPEALLGWESPYENYDRFRPFSNLSLLNYRSLWANPFLLLAKRGLEKQRNELWMRAISTKNPPPFVPLDEMSKTGQKEDNEKEGENEEEEEEVEEEKEVGGNEKGPVATSQQNGFTIDHLDAMTVDDLRACFKKMVGEVRGLVTMTRHQQNEIDYYETELARIRRERVEVEERRRRRKEMDLANMANEKRPISDSGSKYLSDSNRRLFGIQQNSMGTERGGSPHAHREPADSLSRQQQGQFRMDSSDWSTDIAVVNRDKMPSRPDKKSQKRLTDDVCSEDLSEGEIVSD